MKKLTSSDIDWEDCYFIAIISNDNACKCFFKLQNVSEANDRFYIGSDWYLRSEYYIVYREPEPIKKTVVDAVNELQSELEHIENYQRGQLLIIKAKAGYLTTTMSTVSQFNENNDDGYYELICTIEEFNQCVKELSEAAWMNDGEPMFYHVYKQAFKDMELQTKPTYKYEKVTDLTLNEIAKAMIDGEVFYGENGANRYLWENGQFTDKHDGGCFVTGDYYREVEVKTQKRWTGVFIEEGRYKNTEFSYDSISELKSSVNAPNGFDDWQFIDLEVNI